MHLGKNFIARCSLLLLPLMPAVSLTTPALAQAVDPTLLDASQPGSLIVFPKFLKGTVAVDGVTMPATEIEVGVVCPKGSVCPEHQPVKIRFQWVCPGFQAFEKKLICHANNFDVFGSVNGKLVFNPQNLTLTGDTTVNVPQPPCNMGYLLGWVISPANDLPIKYNGLIGDAVIRESATAVSAYGAIPIQAANTAAPTGAFIDTVPDPLTGLPKLAFDGVGNHYKRATGTIIGDVKFTNSPPSPAFPSASTSYLIMLTLDVRSDFPNYPMEVNINWWNESNSLSPSSPLFEKLLSTSFEFVCWTEVPLTMIDPNLTQSQMGSRKGVFRSTNAAKFPWAGIFDLAGPATLLGMVETMEGTVGNERAYFSPVYNNGDGVNTYFLGE